MSEPTGYGGFAHRNPESLPPMSEPTGYGGFAHRNPISQPAPDAQSADAIRRVSYVRGSTCG